jgi:hypothetical protein
MSEPATSFNWLEILDRPIAFHPIFVDLTGSVPAALILSQAFYWQRRTEDPDGWFYKTREEWQEETRLKRYDQEQARALLRKTPYWEEELRGIPARLYYRINLQALQNQLANKLADGLPTRWQTVCQQDGRTSPNKLADGLPTISEITAETTTETTTEIPPPTPPKGGGQKAKGARKTSGEAKGGTIDILAANDYSAGFTAFWDVYPALRKKGKRQAWDIWQSAALESRTAEIVEKVETLKRYDADWLRGYNPEPHRWLQRKGYEDDLALPTQQTLVANGTISEKTRQSLNGVAEFQRRWRNRNGDDGRQRRPVLSLAGENDGDLL